MQTIPQGNFEAPCNTLDMDIKKEQLWLQYLYCISWRNRIHAWLDLKNESQCTIGTRSDCEKLNLPFSKSNIGNFNFPFSFSFLKVISFNVIYLLNYNYEPGQLFNLRKWNQAALAGHVSDRVVCSTSKHYSRLFCKQINIMYTNKRNTRRQDVIDKICALRCSTLKCYRNATFSEISAINVYLRVGC